MNFVDVTGNASRRGRRLVSALALLAVSLPATAAPLTLGDLFGGDSFSQDGLTFDNFRPALKAAPNHPDGDEFLALILAGLLNNNYPDIPNASFIDTGGGDRFSVRWTDGDGSWDEAPSDPADGKGAADASKIGVEILPGAGGAPGVNDPGFRLIGNGELAVDAGFSNPDVDGDDVAGVQVSAFVYDVEKEANLGPIVSADLTQSSSVDAVGPDVPEISFDPFFISLPDVAGGFLLQYVLNIDDPSDILGFNITYDLAVRESEIEVLTASELYDWSGLADQTKVRVLTFIAIGATSEGGFTLDTLEQRIDPPPPPAAPEPGTLALLGLGLAGIGYRRRRGAGTA